MCVCVGIYACMQICKSTRLKSRGCMYVKVCFDTYIHMPHTCTYMHMPSDLSAHPTYTHIQICVCLTKQRLRNAIKDSRDAIFELENEMSRYARESCYLFCFLFGFSSPLY